MNKVKLAVLINDTADALERSKIGGIFAVDKDGNILRDAYGFPFYNMVSVQVFQTVITAQIIHEAYK